MLAAETAEALVDRLRAGVTTTPELERVLEASQSWITRTLRRLIDEGKVLRIGSTRNARYGLRRDIPGIGSQWPLRQVARTGEIHEMGTLHSLAADQYFFEPDPSAAGRGFAWGGLSNSLPYFLQDQRPGGFLGRAVPFRYSELNLPQRVLDWTDEHYLRYVVRRGFDTVGDLILGNESLDDYLESKRHRSPIRSSDREIRYPQMMADVMQGGLPGSSAQGEHPKFATLLQNETGPRHVLVKFSPVMDTLVGQRWGDLLIAEHHAHRILSGAGLPACASRIFIIEGRTYLEMDRFDREGLEGRVGITSLWAIDGTLYSGLDNWIDAAERLAKDRRIDKDTLEQIRLVATFGALIANTDRHFGNLSLHDRYDGRFRLAPIYDMLPMLFAPQHDQIVARTFEAPAPTSNTLRAWNRARELALHYWAALTQDARISDDFRNLCAECSRAVTRN